MDLFENDITFLDNVIAFLRCNTDTARVYCSVLHAPKSADEMTQLVSDVNPCIAFLTSHCLIADYEDKRNNKLIYFAIDPRYSLASLVINEMWALDSDLHSFEDLQRRKDLVELNKRYKLCIHLIKPLVDAYEKQLPFLNEINVKFKGPKRIASCIVEMLEGVNTEITAVLSPPHLLGEIVWCVVVDKMKEGVRYNRVTTFDEINRHGFEISRKEALEHKETMYIYAHGELHEKFYIIDDFAVVFFVRDRKHRNFKFEVQIAKNAGIANMFKDTYSKLVNESINFLDLIPAFEKFRTFFIDRTSGILSEKGKRWLTDIFNEGVFYARSKYSDDEIESALKICLDNFWVTSNETGEVIASYNLEEVLEHAC